MGHGPAPPASCALLAVLIGVGHNCPAPVCIIVWPPLIIGALLCWAIALLQLHAVLDLPPCIAGPILVLPWDPGVPTGGHGAAVCGAVAGS